MVLLKVSEKEKEKIEEVMRVLLLPSLADYFRFSFRLALLQKKSFLSFLEVFRREKAKKNFALTLYPTTQERKYVEVLARNFQRTKTDVYVAILLFPSELYYKYDLDGKGDRRV